MFDEAWVNVPDQPGGGEGPAKHERLKMRDEESCVYCGEFTRDYIPCANCTQWSCKNCLVIGEEMAVDGWLCELCVAWMGGGLEELYDD